MNKSFVTMPLGNLVEPLLLENKLLGFLFSSFIGTIRNKMLWTIAIVALSSSKGFALEVTSFVTQCPHGAHIFFDQKSHIFFKVISHARGAIFIFTIFFHIFHLHKLGGGSRLHGLQGEVVGAIDPLNKIMGLLRLSLQQRVGGEIWHNLIRGQLIK